jgi:autotransporter-associated beta strand protein
MNFHNRFNLYHGLATRLCVALAAVSAVVGIASTSLAQIIGPMDSANFGVGAGGTAVGTGFKYEMDVMPSTQDLNGNAVNDYGYFDFEGDITTSDGKAHIVNPVLTPPQANSYVSGGDETDGIWWDLFQSAQYTVEFRAKVTQFTPGLLYDGFPVTAAMTVMANQSNGTSSRRGGGQVWLGDTFVDWGYQQTGNHLLSGIDNTNDFHTYRFVKKVPSNTATNSGTPFEVWRDGVSLGSVIRATSNNTNFHYFGGATSGVAGEAEIDYLRIQVGAYAPAIVTWNGSSDTDWAVGGNWDGGLTPTNNVAILGTDQTQSPTANQPALSGTDLVGGVNFNSGRGGWSIGGAGTLTLGSGGIDTTNAAHDGTNPITTYVTDTVSLASIVLADDSTWTMGGDASYRKMSVSSIISGSRNLTVTGGSDPSNAGILELTGVNTYTGTTTVNSGTLLVNGSLATGSAVAVNGGVLGGTGTIGGPVTVASGGTLSPGASIESLDVGSLAMSGGKLTFELAAPGSPGVTSDLLNVVDTNGLSITSGTVDLIDFGGLASGTYTLVEYAGTALGDATVDLLTIGLQPAGFTYDLVDNATNLSIDLVVTPAGVSGDHNGDGKVDAADYVVWRKDPTMHDNDQGYLDWRANFGTGSGAGSSSSLGTDRTSVPEPASPTLVATSLALLFGWRRHARSTARVVTI